MVHLWHTTEKKRTNETERMSEWVTQRAKHSIAWCVILNCKWCISRCRTKTLILNIYEWVCGTYAENLTPSSHHFNHFTTKIYPVISSPFSNHFSFSLWMYKICHSIIMSQKQHINRKYPMHTYRFIIISMSCHRRLILAFYVYELWMSGFCCEYQPVQWYKTVKTVQSIVAIQ